MNKWLFTILRNALTMATPQILEDLRKTVQDMMDRAKETVNPWDDIFIGLLQLIIGKPNQKIEANEDLE